MGLTDSFSGEGERFLRLACDRGLPALPPGTSYFQQEVFEYWSRSSATVQEVYLLGVSIFSKPLAKALSIHMFGGTTATYAPEPLLQIFTEIDNGNVRLAIGDALANSKPINPCPGMLELVHDESIDPVDRQALYRPIRVHCGKATAREIMIAQHDPESMFWLGEFAYVVQTGPDIDLMRPGLKSEDAEIRSFAKRKIASAEKRVAKKLGIV